jgi:hypothetical protein
MYLAIFAIKSFGGSRPRQNLKSQSAPSLRKVREEEQLAVVKTVPLRSLRMFLAVFAIKSF